MAQQEMAIFTRTFDFLTVLLPMTNHFPTTQRHTATRRLLAPNLAENALFYQDVIPAKAGIQLGDAWIPAFAGMTMV